MLSSKAIREKFLTYFEERGHQRVASSSLVPGNDPTLLFTNAGMVQFKDVFLGVEKRNYTRATSSQRCVRAGGKHNDLENVGYTARHHTFFEMLGNFSFGDYFKEDAIKYAWEFLTEVIKLPKEKLWVTVYEEDQEAEDIWLKKIGVSAERFSRKGKKDNFWQMGDTGPCGPCSEIFYDHGSDVAGGPPGSADEEGDRYIEIWNLVFMQYNRAADGTLTPLPKPSVDTGMGLERLAAVLQDVHSNYEIDLFVTLINAVAKLAACKDKQNKSLRVIADHIRSCAFLIVDGVIPSNEGRGYVLRRIIRRAIRHGYQLGVEDAFFYKLVDVLAQEMGEAYPELLKDKARVASVLKKEEERFAETLEQGMAILNAELLKIKGKQLSGDVIFKLYDTYGFPVDLTADVAREKNIALDMDGFEVEMNQQRERARASSKFEMGAQHAIDANLKSLFKGYECLTLDSEVLAVGSQEADIQSLSEGEQGLVVLKETPFYAESGGQVGDRGELQGKDFVFVVDDTQKQGNAVLHLGRVKKGSVRVGDVVTANVNPGLRQATALHHSATHLMHAALREVLGEHVQQKGSLVDAEHLRFDFSHYEAVTPEQLLRIEQIVNQHIRENRSAETKLMSLEAAKKSGAMALFGEKYEDKVRVLSIGEYSVELCGGTHVQRAGDIGIFKITAEYGVAAGVRRIEAVVGDIAFAYFSEIDKQLGTIASRLKASNESVEEKVVQLLERNRGLEKEVQQLKSKLAANSGNDLISKAVDVEGIKVLASAVEGVDNKSLRELVDRLKDQLGSAAIVLATVDNERVILIAGVTKDLLGRLKAGDLVNSVAKQVGGKGGGRPDMAQAGGDNPAALAGALESVPAWVRETVTG